jgi:hypothetical protein
MYQSHVIEVFGVFAGAAVTTSGNFRFIAVDPRFEDLDQSEWPSLSDIRRVATHVFTTGRLPERCTLAPHARCRADAGLIARRIGRGGFFDASFNDALDA